MAGAERTQIPAGIRAADKFRIDGKLATSCKELEFMRDSACKAAGWNEAAWRLQISIGYTDTL